VRVRFPREVGSRRLGHWLVDVVGDGRNRLAGEPLPRVHVVEVGPGAVVGEGSAPYLLSQSRIVTAQVDELSSVEGPAGSQRERVPIVHAPDLAVSHDGGARARGPPGSLKAELVHESREVNVCRREELRSSIDHEPVDDLRGHPAPDGFGCLQHTDGDSRLDQAVRGDETSEAGADDENLRVAIHVAFRWWSLGGTSLRVQLVGGSCQTCFGGAREISNWAGSKPISAPCCPGKIGAHRTAASGAPATGDLPFRFLIGDPCDLARRSIVPAISALTIRRTATDASFVLHWRDSAKVAHGGGLYQVMPVGVFQPSDSGAWNVANDFDLWRSMAREYSEEFIGTPEHRGTDGPLDYNSWHFYRSLTDARDNGKITAHLLGAGVDPLSLVTDLLVAVVFDADVFDGLFGGIGATNAEGCVVGARPVHSGIAGLPLGYVDGSATSRPMQAAGAAGLVLSREHTSILLPWMSSR
jgi:hypothetical protein